MKMKVFSKTQRIVALSLAATAITLFLVFRQSPLPVDSDVVRRGPLEVTLDAEGFTRVNERFAVSAPVSGRLARIVLREGDRVRKNDQLAELLPPGLDSREYREASASAASAKAAYDEAVARERRALLDYRQSARRSVRYRNLFREGAVSREAFELTGNDAEVLRKESEAARSAALSSRYAYEAQQAVIDLQTAGKPVPVLAPAEGTVLMIHEKSERVVAAGAPLVDIGDPSDIEIVIDVLSSDAVRIRAGNPVVIEEWGGEKPLGAVVRRIEPAAFNKVSALGIEEKRVNVVAALKRYEPLLGDNFRVQTRIVLQQAGNVLLVPVSSLFRGSSGWKVFVIRRGKAVEKSVRIGMRGSVQAEVLAGLENGTRVVVHPTNELHDGMRVTFQQ